jgi:ABC-type amino acid transport substrate-binding protein
MDYLISKPEDLARGKVATVRDSVSDNYLKSRKIYPYYYENVSDGLQAIEEKKVDAMVYDAPLLKYMIKERYRENIMVVDRLFDEQNYAIALPTNSLLREQINIAMLEIISSREWEEIKEKYMGHR